MIDKHTKIHGIILVIEDDDGLRELIVKTLNKEGYQAVGCSNGGTALERIAADAPVALLIDQKLPDMTGLELLTTLADHGAMLPFMVMTGQGDERLAVEMMKLGASDYLIKDMDFLDILPVAIQRMFNAIRTEQALRQKSEELAAVVEAMPAMVWIAHDPECRYITGNRLVYNLVGVPYGSNLSQSAVSTGEATYIKHLRMDGTEIPAHELPIQQAIASAQPIMDLEFKYVFPNGQHKIVIGNTIPLFDSAGRVSGAVSIFIDITGRKRAEAERKKLQSQLAQSQKMESIGALAGGVAHDFNNMLGVIMGYAELGLLETNSEQPIHHRLKQIMEISQRSGDMVQQLLAFARKQIITPRVLDFNSTVKDMLNMLRRLIGEHIHLVWRPDPNLWAIKLDPSQINQLLVNLCINARDAITDTGSITIETLTVELDDEYCSQHPECEPGEYVLLSVSDTGSGIAPENLPHIFDPFYTTKEIGQGTGLGLSTVYGIVKQNKGHIMVYTEPGQGTCFKIYLPRYIEAIPERTTPASSEPLPGGHETILLVEDAPEVLEMCVMMLEKLGYRVISTAEPSEALRLAATHHNEIDLLITDVIMPNMNGRELASCLTVKFPQLRCLFMSGYTADIIARQGVLDEGVQFIQKPFFLRQLAVKVREALGEGTNLTIP